MKSSLSSTFTAALAAPVDEDELDELPLLPHLPLDEEDPRFTKSFHPIADLKSLLEFFNQYGYVVLHSVFNANECDETRRAMFDILEQRSPGYHHDDVSTFHLLNSKGKYGLSMRNPSFHERLVCNRQHERLIVVLDHIIRNSVDHSRADVSLDPTCCIDDHDGGDIGVTHHFPSCISSSSSTVTPPPPPKPSISSLSSSSSSSTAAAAAVAASITPIPVDRISDLDVIVSHDRFAVYRPTLIGLHGCCSSKGGEGIDLSNLYGNDAVNSGSSNSSSGSSSSSSSSGRSSSSSSSSSSSTGDDAHRKESSVTINSSTFSTGTIYFDLLLLLNTHHHHLYQYHYHHHYRLHHCHHHYRLQYESIAIITIIIVMLFITHDRNIIITTTSGVRNIHLDMNPWWWLESSAAILDGLETLRYEDNNSSCNNSNNNSEGQDFIKENNMVVQSMGR